MSSEPSPESSPVAPLVEGDPDRIGPWPLPSGRTPRLRRHGHRLRRADPRRGKGGGQDRAPPVRLGPRVPGALRPRGGPARQGPLHLRRRGPGRRHHRGAAVAGQRVRPPVPRSAPACTPTGRSPTPRWPVRPPGSPRPCEPSTRVGSCTASSSPGTSSCRPRVPASWTSAPPGPWRRRPPVRVTSLRKPPARGSDAGGAYGSTGRADRLAPGRPVSADHSLTRSSGYSASRLRSPGSSAS